MTSTSVCSFAHTDVPGIVPPKPVTRQLTIHLFIIMTLSRRSCDVESMSMTLIQRLLDGRGAVTGWVKPTFHYNYV